MPGLSAVNRQLQSATPLSKMAGKQTSVGSLVYFENSLLPKLELYSALKAGLLVTSYADFAVAGNWQHIASIDIVRFFHNNHTQHFYPHDKVYIVGNDGRKRFFRSRFQFTGNWQWKPGQDPEVTTDRSDTTPGSLSGERSLTPEAR